MYLKSRPTPRQRRKFEEGWKSNLGYIHHNRTVSNSQKPTFSPFPTLIFAGLFKSSCIFCSNAFCRNSLHIYLLQYLTNSLFLHLISLPSDLLLLIFRAFSTVFFSGFVGSTQSTRLGNLPEFQEPCSVAHF